MISNTINHKRIIPEILAPAGTEEALMAAVNAGCDAVYLGGNMFSARAFAGNFDTEAMVKVIDYCHLFGVKLYMTVNTLLKEDELAALPAYMKPFYEAGLDGVIVQDVGVVRILQREFPLMPVHGSTQMSIASAYGAKLLKGLGITRVVPARELSLEEIKSIHDKVDIEIESFVHGAMCYAYSGKCLLSSYLGGRSGNRGRCAQPCRQIYEIQTKSGKGDKNQARTVREYAMSLKDMCTLSILPQLIDAGIASFKIEGRMKNPSYVAATVAAYREARDFYLELCDKEVSTRGISQVAAKSAGGDEQTGAVTWETLPEKSRKRYMDLAERLICDMQDIYNRGGFHTGYYFTNKGMEMTANKRPNHLGLFIGEVTSVKGPDVNIRLSQDVNPQDVLEITPVQVEITSNKEGKAGAVISLKGKELKKIKPGMKVYRTRNNQLLDRIDADIIKPEKQIAAEALIVAKVGEAMAITMAAAGKAYSAEATATNANAEAEAAKVQSEVKAVESVGQVAVREMNESLVKISVTVCGNVIEAAGNKPTDASQLISKIQKTGGSNVKLSAVCDMDDNAFVPMSEFNNLRREAIEKLKKAISDSYHRNPVQ